MQKNISESKVLLRRQIRERLKKMDSPQRATDSARACSLVKRQTIWQKAKTILFYAPLPEELDIWPLVDDGFKAGKIIGLLRFDSKTGTYAACRIDNPVSDLRVGEFRIREPNEQCVGLLLDQLDLVFVPGVAFDLYGRRLGRGRGIYDRLLAATAARTCGVAFDEQVVPEIPMETHDIHVEYVLTPTRWVQTRITS